LKSASTASYGTTKSNVGNTVHSDAVMSLRGERGHPESCTLDSHWTPEKKKYGAGFRPATMARRASHMRIEHVHRRRE
jgi:hypothetical protein